MHNAIVYSILLQWMISQSTNSEYADILRGMLNKTKGKKELEQHDHPKHQSILIFGNSTLFPFSDDDYSEMVEILIQENAEKSRFAKNKNNRPSNSPC